MSVVALIPGTWGGTGHILMLGRQLSVLLHVNKAFNWVNERPSSRTLRQGSPCMTSELAAEGSIPASMWQREEVLPKEWMHCLMAP